MRSMWGCFVLLVSTILAAGLSWSAEDLSAAEAQPAASAPDAASAEEASRSYFTDLPLLNQDGQTVRFYSDVLKGRVVLINFIFTHCQDACPLITRQLNEVRATLGEQMANPIYFVSISIDPEHDTPEAMKEFAEKNQALHPGWIFLTGDKQNVDLIVKKLGQYTGEVEDHSTLMLAGNVKTRHWMKIPPVVPPFGIAEKLRMLAEDS